MPGRECSSGELKRLLSESQRLEVDRHMSQGLGVALYEDDRSRPILVVPTGGGRGYDIPGYPPAIYGGGTLSMFIPPQPKAGPVGSQYTPPPQIRRPRVSPAFTEVPDVRIAMRESGNPRVHSEYLNAQRLLPGREPEQVLPQREEAQQPLTEVERWWRDHLPS
jgi:hypothetical protein